MEETSICPYPDCQKPFSNCYNLKKHINSHHLKIKPFKCSFCSKSFGYKHSMLHHQVSHEQAEREKYTGEVQVLDLCTLLNKSKDPELCPFAKIKVKRMKRKRADQDLFALLPEIRGDKVPEISLPQFSSLT